MGTLLQDFRYGLRVLRKSPGFTAIAVITLALGIGANVSIFSFVDELWLRPMPVPQADRLVRIYTSSPASQGEIERGYNSYPDFEDLRAGAKTLSGLALLQRRGAMYDDGSQNRLVSAAVLSDNFFEVLRPAPAWGRTFTESELRNSGTRPIVISYPFWRRAFNADPGIAGRSIVLDRQPVVVLGVLPRGFRGTEPLMVPDVWIPRSTWQQLMPGDRFNQVNRNVRDYELFGRLKDNVTVPQSRAELSAIAGRLALAYPRSNTNRKITALPEGQTRGEVASIGLVLLGVAALVLLIACANVASLLIARTEYRRKEIATRIALGASRGRIVRQLLIETLILALAGGAAALVLGRAVLQALPSFMPQTSVPTGVDAYVSARGLVMAVAVVVLSLLLFAVIPALLATKLSPAGGLRQHGAEPGRVRVSTRSALVVTQVALSLVLVVSAGLLVRSLWNGLKLDPGFNAHQSMLVIDFAPDLNSDAENMRLTEELRRRIEALPGVAGTTAALRVPFGLSGSGLTEKVFVSQSPGADREGATIHYDPVADRYFEILGTRIIRGRAIDRRDVETHARVLVVNQQMAARFWPNQDGVGQRFRLDRADGEEYEVIGVAENGRYNDIQEDAMPYFFVPMRAQDYGEVEMAVKTTTDPGIVATPFRQTLRALNANAPIIDLVTMRDHVRQALYVQLVTSRLISTLGLLGLVLVAVGIYGLMSFVVGKRTHEIGVRLALGSQRSAIFRLMLRYVLQLTLIGAVIGVAAAVAAGHYLRSLLVGVAPTDLLVFSLATAVLLAMAFLAALAPAMSAVRVDPIIALRDE